MIRNIANDKTRDNRRNIWWNTNKIQPQVNVRQQVTEFNMFTMSRIDFQKTTYIVILFSNYSTSNTQKISETQWDRYKIYSQRNK